MKVVAYDNLCKKKRKKHLIVYCTQSIFKPLFVSMSVLLLLLVMNLFVNNFFANIQASVQNFVGSFVKYVLGVEWQWKNWK